MTNCSSPQTGQIDQFDKIVDVALDMNASDTKITVVVGLPDDVKPTQLGAESLKSTNVVTVYPATVEAFRQGRITPSGLMFMICHELGHLAPAAKFSGGGMAEEKYADFYGLLLVDEIIEDHADTTRLGVKLDLESAIHLFDILNVEKHVDGIHPQSAERIRYLQERIDLWKHHQGEKELG